MDTLELANLLGATHLGSRRAFKGFSIDSRQVEEGRLFVAIKGKVHDGHDFALSAVEKGAVGVLCERRLELPEGYPQILVQDTVGALRRIALFKRERFKGKVIAIAGSAGKTTTKELTAFLLSKLGKVCKTPKNYNSQIGVPLSVANFDEDCEFWVVEVGASQKGDVKSLVEIVKPHVRAITAIGEEHLETFGCLDDVVLGNGEVFSHMSEEDWGVCPHSVSHCYHIERKLTFGEGSLWAEDLDISLQGVRFKVQGVEVSLVVPSLAVVENVLCTLRILEALDVDWRPLSKELVHFKPVEGRFRVFRKGGLVIIDDTYNANPPSVRIALKTLGMLKGYRVAVIGDMLELGADSHIYHREIGSLCKELNIDMCLFYGDHTKHAYDECLKSGGHCLFFESKEDILRLLLNLKEGIILFKGSRSMGMESLVEGLLSI